MDSSQIFDILILVDEFISSSIISEKDGFVSTSAVYEEFLLWTKNEGYNFRGGKIHLVDILRLRWGPICIDGRRSGWRDLKIRDWY